jgi:hypothetical protein
VGADQLDSGDRLQLAAPLVEDELDVAERFQPPAEAGRRPADPLCECADTPSVERVEVKHAVGLSEAQRTQDDRLGLVRAARHAESLETSSARTP